MGNRPQRQTDWRAIRHLIETHLSSPEGLGVKVQIHGEIRAFPEGLDHDSYHFFVDVVQTGVPDIEEGFFLRLPKASTADRSRPQQVRILEREARTLDAIAAQDWELAAPRPVCRLRGEPGFIETAVPGISVQAFRNTPRAADGIELIGRAAAAVHRLPVKAFAHLEPVPDAAAHVMLELGKAIGDGSALAVYPEARAARAWVVAHLPQGRPAVVLHGDLLPQNLLCDVMGNARLGLIDWEYAQIGDPAYDLAIVTRGSRKILGLGDGLRLLLDAYVAAGGMPLTPTDVQVHEVILMLSWLVQSCRPGRREGHAPEHYADLLSGLLRRGPQQGRRPSAEVSVTQPADRTADAALAAPVPALVQPPPAGRPAAPEPLRECVPASPDPSAPSGPPRQVTIYTDGAAHPNPGRGGYGVVLLYEGHRKELSGGYRRTTNNRMEILAAIRGLEALREPCRVTLYTDSQYVANAMTRGWVQRWRRNRWLRGPDEAAKNPDLWEQLYQLCQAHQVAFTWVRGHAASRENNRCDALATEARHRPDLAPDPGYENES